MSHTTNRCPDCGHDTTPVKLNRLNGEDGWKYICPQCDPAPPHHDPAPNCIQCGQPMNHDKNTWICEPCCWTRDQNGQWAHDTLRLATHTLTTENQTKLNTPAEAYVTGFLAAWDKALELCRSVESNLGNQ